MSLSLCIPSRAASSVLLLGAVVLLGGCAELRPYEEPVTGKITRLRIATDSLVQLYPARSCEEPGPRSGNGPVVGEGTTLMSQKWNGRSLGMPDADLVAASGLGTSELQVQADEPLLLLYRDVWVEHRSMHDVDHACEFRLLFVPKEGVDYQAVARHNSDRTACGIVGMVIGESGRALPEYVKVQNLYDKAACEKANAEELRSAADAAERRAR